MTLFDQEITDAIARADLRLASVDVFDFPGQFGLLLDVMEAGASGDPRPVEFRIARGGAAGGVLDHGVRARLIHTIDALGPHLARLDNGTWRVILDLSDNGSPNGISMDRPAGSSWLLMPDLYSLQVAQTSHEGSDRTAFSTEYRSRRKSLFWRGSTTGVVITSPDLVEINHRVRFCLHTRTRFQGLADCRLSSITQVLEHERVAVEGRLRDLDIFGDRVDEHEFMQWAFYPDLDGNTSSWGSVRKFLGGMTVLKLDQGRETDFSSMLTHWKDVVRVAGDLQDFDHKYQILLSEPALSEQIAWSGHTTAVTYLNSIPARLAAIFRSETAQRLAATCAP